MERPANHESGGEPQAAAPQAAVVPIGDEWAAGVHPIAVAPRSRRLRWAVAGAVVVIVALVTTAGTFVLSGAVGSKSLTASMAPKNSLYFMELRTDLPGNQRAKLSDFMSHFPGWQDRAQFNNAMDELLNMLIGRVSPDLNYTSAFKPWMEGEVSIAVGDLGAVETGNAPVCSQLSIDKISIHPDAQTVLGGMSLARVPSAVAIFALKDHAGAQNWINAELNQLKLTGTSQDYAGAKLYTVGSGVLPGAYALTDNDLLLGTVLGVKAALDTRTNGSLADNPDYQAAMGSLSGDSLARFYVDVPTVVAQGLDSSAAFMCGVLGEQGATLPTAVDTSSMPRWLAGAVRAEAEAMVVDMALPRMGIPSFGNHSSRIAASLPGNTVGMVEVHSLGPVVQDVLGALESIAPLPGLDAGSLKSVDSVLSLVGGVGWLSDGTAVVTRNGSTFDGGVVAEAADAATAKSKVDLAGSLIGLSSIATGLKASTETYSGRTITLVSVPGAAGRGPLQISFAAKDNLVVVGYTDAFVKAVLDTTPASSLASQPDYSTAIGASGSNNEGSLYINVPQLEDEVGRAVFPTDQSRWTIDYRPYLDHVGGIAASVTDGNTVMVRLVVTAR
ncbi:MAG: DUF3352 domain-containing protein [Candidatus Limnocylindrales bacterium]